MFLTDTQLSQIIEFRHELHRYPEISGEEGETARRVTDALRTAGADEVICSIGGHGVVGIFRGRDDGPTLMFRSELDALPIEEVSDLPYRSQVPGKAHLCGHDGHSSILLAVAVILGQKRPARGRVILMFQPAEENGAGARAVVADPKFAPLKPDLVFSLHNLPGIPLGHVALREGPVTCSTRGMKIIFSGKTAHASMPEQGVPPTFAIARLLTALTALGRGDRVDENFLRVTVTHASLGEQAFGISPGRGEIWATLRSLTSEAMDSLVTAAETLVRNEAVAEALSVTVSYHDIFEHCSNAPEPVSELRQAMRDVGGTFDEGDGLLPMRPGEDFGVFGRHAPSAMMFLGAGKTYAGLHNPDYDFPDELIPVGSDIFLQTVRNMLG
jgi:amidohydrolase